MGTRSITTIRDEHDEHVVTLYRQYDGYLRGHGKELRDFLAARQEINGISGQTAKNYANGIGCLAAQMVAHFKTSIGGVYLQPELTADDRRYVDYVYTVRPLGVGQSFHVTVEKGGSTKLYSGPVRDWPLDVWCVMDCLDDNSLLKCSSDELRRWARHHRGVRNTHALGSKQNIIDKAMNA